MAMLTNDKKAFYPDTTLNPSEVIPEALIYKIATVAASNIEGDAPAVKVPYVKADPTSGFTDEGADISSSDATLDEITVVTRKIAVLTKQSRESMSYDAAADSLAASLQRSVIIKANTALLSNSGTPAGLLTVPGIIDAGKVTDNFDAISDAITKIEVNGGTASCIVTDPASWGALCKLKTANGTLQLGNPAEQAERRLFGLPVYTSAQMTPGQMLVIDSNTLIAAVGDLQVDTSEEVYFASDSIARRITWRLGWNLVHPDRVAKITVSAAAKAAALAADTNTADEPTGIAEDTPAMAEEAAPAAAASRSTPRVTNGPNGDEETDMLD